MIDRTGGNDAEFAVAPFQAVDGDIVGVNADGSQNENIKLYTISTLVLMASGMNGKVLSTIDARRGNCFGCIYDLESESFVQNEGMYERVNLELNSYDSIVNENEFKVDSIKVIKLSSLVDEVRTLVPNYLRDTEAERNLNA